MTHRSTNEMQLWMPKVELFVWPKIWMNLYQCKHVFSLMSGESWTSSQLKLGPSLSWLYRYTFDPSVWWSLDNFHLVAIWSLPLPGAFTRKWRVGPCPDAVAKHHSPPFLDLFHAGAVTRPLLDMLLNSSHCEPNGQWWVRDPKLDNPTNSTSDSLYKNLPLSILFNLELGCRYLEVARVMCTLKWLKCYGFTPCRLAINSEIITH